ncbi:hypothetical protein JW998_02125 [candidate division KSB1 bacterium]|nr:hypothetical protein [candidate division KSB1 bacterium]
MKKMIVLSTLCALVAVNVKAQYAAYDDENWRNEFSLLSWMPGQSGTITIQGVEYDADLVFDKLIRKVNWSLNLKYEGRRDLWMIQWSGAFTKSFDMSDERDVETALTLTDATIGFMPWWERFYLLAGGRYFDVSGEAVDKTGQEIEKKTASKGWFDLFLGARYEIPVTDRFAIRLRGDVGGLGSTLSWSTTASFRWSITNFALEAGYHTCGADYQDGSGEKFKYDVVTTGPGIGITFLF